MRLGNLQALLTGCREARISGKHTENEHRRQLAHNVQYNIEDVLKNFRKKMPAAIITIQLVGDTAADKLNLRQFRTNSAHIVSERRRQHRDFLERRFSTFKEYLLDSICGAAGCRQPRIYIHFLENNPFRNRKIFYWPLYNGFHEIIPYR